MNPDRYGKGGNDMAEKAAEVRLILARSQKGHDYYQVEVTLGKWKTYVYVDAVNAEYLENQGLQVVDRR